MGEIHAGSIQQSDARHADVMFHVAGRAAGKVHRPGLMIWPVFLFKVLREPVCPVPAIAGPDISFFMQRRRHHFKRREGHLLIFINQLAPQFHPRGLDGQRCGAAQVAQLTGGADNKGVHHELVPLLATFHVLTQPVPFPARALALPAPPVELVTFINTVATLGATVSIPSHISGNAFYRPGRRFPDMRGNIIAQRPYQRFNRFRSAYSQPYPAAIKHFTGIENAPGVDLPLEGPEPGNCFRTEYLGRLFAEVESGGVGSATVFFGNLHNGE